MEFSTIDTTQIIVTLLTVMGGILFNAKGRKGKAQRADKTKQPINIWAVGMWACIAIAVVNTGILGWRWLRPPPPPSVKITYPANLGRVDMTETIIGTVQGLQEGEAIWVVLFIKDVGRYYPQNLPATIEAGGRWSSLAYIGVPSDDGMRFDILAIIANAEAQNAFKAYLAEAGENNNWAGMEVLPQGAVIYDRVTVTRR